MQVLHGFARPRNRMNRRSYLNGRIVRQQHFQELQHEEGRSTFAFYSVRHFLYHLFRHTQNHHHDFWKRQRGTLTSFGRPTLIINFFARNLFVEDTLRALNPAKRHFFGAFYYYVFTGVMGEIHGAARTLCIHILLFLCLRIPSRDGEKERVCVRSKVVERQSLPMEGNHGRNH